MRDANLFKICMIITLVYLVLLIVSVARQKLALNNGLRLVILVLIPFLGLIVFSPQEKNYGNRSFHLDSSSTLLIYVSILQIIFYIHYLILKLNKLETSRIMLMQEIALLRYKIDNT
jgi:hypothetical protein